MADVGRWITPQGQDSTYNMTDIFGVSVGGMDNPGSINISLEAGRSIGSSQQGVYACIIPDEGGLEQTQIRQHLHVMEPGSLHFLKLYT